MKRLHFLVLFSLLSGVLFAVPYASKITINPKLIPSGGSLDISYFINESGGTVTVEIVEEGNPSNVAATFAGTATEGANTVAWDGTNNNAGGTVVPDGNYRVKITVDATKAAGWTELHSNSSVANLVPVTIATERQQLWSGFSPMEWLIDLNPDNDSFGYIMVGSSNNLPQPPIHGLAVFNPDLSTADGGDGSTTYMNYTPDDIAGAYTSIWGLCFDPDDPTKVWVAGQDPPANVMLGTWNGSTVTDVDNGNTNLLLARGIAVRKEGAKKYAYITQGTALLWKCEVTNNLVESSVNIFNLSDVGRYSKCADFDSNGNLYFSSRRNNADGTGGAIFRWDASVIEAASEGSLTEANASWNVQFPTGALDVEGVAIGRDGNVYAACCTESAADGSVRGIYLIGNVSQASNNKTLTTSDRVVAYPVDLAPSPYGHGIGVDYAGNLYITDRVAQQVRCYSPGGTTSVSALGPTSQSFFVGIVSARNWILYE
jgi:hypothetical protein